MNNALIFLINTLFDLYLFVLAIRLLLAIARANYFHPFTQFVLRLTQPLVMPVRRFIPNFRQLETATLLWMMLIALIKMTLLTSLLSGIPPVGVLLVLAISCTLRILLQTLFYAILAQAVISWVAPYGSPMGEMLATLTAPVMRPLRRIIPPVAGIDITPIPALILLQFLAMLLP